MTEKPKKKNWIKEHKMGIFVITSAVLMLIGLSYAWLSLTLRGEKELSIITAGELYLVLDDSMTGGISISKALPVTDEEGVLQEGYTFTLENKGNTKSDYTLYLDDLDLTEENTRMNDSFIKYQLIRDGEEIGLDLLSSTGNNPNRVLDSGTISVSKKYTYTLKLWIDENATNEAIGKTFKGQIRIEASQSAKVDTMVEKLWKKSNRSSLVYANASEEEKKEMFMFKHAAGEQQAGWSEEELTDYRYIGENPNNYVTFNDELWRIIGIFIVEDENGKKEERVKIILNDRIAQCTWKTQSSSFNDWTTSETEKLLNEKYYNRTNGSCASDTGYFTLDYLSTIGLTDIARGMVGKTKWYLGGWNTNNITASQFYEYERGNKIYKGSDDYQIRARNWIGEVGLIYPSDYGYAASDSSCLSTSLSSYGSSCRDTNWLYYLLKNGHSSNDLYRMWTMTSLNNNKDDIFVIRGSGSVDKATSYTRGTDIIPSVYLKSNVKIASGKGTVEEPYILAMD